MAFGSFNPQRQSQPMADINVTPMVDVMLVLLVIFILSAPMFTHAVKLELPKAQSPAAGQQASTVTLSIDGAGQVFWNAEPLSMAALDERMAAASQQAPQPELQLRADKNTRYEVVAQVMAAAQGKGLTKLGFVTDATKENK
ncbi:MAG: ExbD/TolR family protein [Sphingomonadaceae bacterium]